MKKYELISECGEFGEVSTYEEGIQLAFQVMQSLGVTPTEVALHVSYTEGIPSNYPEIIVSPSRNYDPVFVLRRASFSITNMYTNELVEYARNKEMSMEIISRVSSDEYPVLVEGNLLGMPWKALVKAGGVDYCVELL